MLSYHNDENLKKLIVCEMRKHQEQDQFVKNTYGREECGKFNGCAVGCAIDSINIALGKRYRSCDHKVFEEALGIPEFLAHLQDSFFERLPIGENSQFAVDFLSAVPTGVNLEPVKWKFCSFILKEGIDRILLQHNLSEELMDQVVSAMRGVLNLHESAINTGEWDLEAAESAAELARSAAWSAESARSAAWSAASAAAWSAASAAAWSAWSAASAAESAEYRRYANELIRLLKDSK